MPTHSGQQQPGELAWRMTGSVPDVADILAEFAEELRRGDVNVWKDQRSLHLHPESQLALSVEASVGQGGRHELRLQLHWGEDAANM
jgi:amphi-Trp domain-containing protein